MARITGRVNVKVNGKVLLTKYGTTNINGLGISGEMNVELKEVMGDQGISGFVEEPMPATCELTLTDRDDFSVSELSRIRENGTVIVESAGGGKVYTLNNATCKRNNKVTSGEGDLAVIFSGNYWVESREEAV